MDTDNRELYRIISGFPKYCISNRGRVMNILSGKYLSTSRNKHGYLLVDLYNGTSHKIFYVHRLVASYFIQNPENLCCVDHMDLEGNKVAEYISAAEAGRIFGCNSRYISRVCAGERKSYKSFIWKYKV